MIAQESVPITIVEWLEMLWEVRKDYRDHILPEFTDLTFADMLNAKEPMRGVARALLKEQYRGHMPKTFPEFLITAPGSLWQVAKEWSNARCKDVSTDKEVLAGGARMWLSDLYFQVRYEVGCHRFAVSPGLAIKLWNTSPAGIDRRFLRLPFPTIEVIISGDTFLRGEERLCWRLWQDNMEDLPEWANNISESGEVISCVFGYVPRGGGEFLVDGNRSTELNDKPITDSVLVGEKWSMKIDEEVVTSAADAMNFVYNILLYMNLHTKDHVEDKTRIHQIHSQLQGLRGAKRKPLEVKLAEYKKSPIFVVGKSVLLPGGVPLEAIRPDSPQRRTHWRRGHWKHQACGKLWSEHKWIHVEPTLVRGYGEAITKDYVVTTEQQVEAP